MYINVMKASGVSLTLEDYRCLSSLNRDDLVLWNEAEVQRTKDEVELARLGGARKS